MWRKAVPLPFVLVAERYYFKAKRIAATDLFRVAIGVLSVVCGGGLTFCQNGQEVGLRFPVGWMFVSKKGQGGSERL